MKTTAVTHENITCSVLAVPPLARHADLSLNREANKALIHHMESGGVRTLLYGGNANFYNIPVSEYAEVLDFLEETVGADTWVIPSVGPDYGKMIDQAAILRQRKFPTAMILPLMFPSTDAGAMDGIRRFSDAFAQPVIIYIKNTTFLQPESVEVLAREGRIAAIKYAIVRDAPEQDEFLTRLLQLVDKSKVISGIGERPAIVHLRDFGLSGFTSGSVCVGPRGSMELLRAIQSGNFLEAEQLRAAYMPLEDCRDALNPIRVLHDAVTAAGIADMGPMLPMLSRLDSKHQAHLGVISKALLAHDKALDLRNL
ncbi:dihydrodipicolinate synthase family protein [Paralcaligenes ureilyticus]|uniref:Dihydrodipicolinate synthase/N-acetylneuraminate lyase n=1 Tax=Paralcaligenes ureilyticus TaxID=627131 RepID=A0A4R3M331_9BURK|nr:dihydrodipicolinate synthase family protein [Paralcaligenes ureilyticus]TCT07136.1 dihydrodipicolinate synthase/N-acetylneuraminate lyase [Paralcaligenes ureilyticus]